LVIDRRGERGSTLNHLINSLKRDHVNPTHFLLVSFSFSPDRVSAKTQNAIRRAFFQNLNENKYSLEISADEDQISIKWKAVNKTSSTLYYCVSRLDETYVRQLTKGLVKSVFQKILEDNDLDLSEAQLNYLTSKNMEFTINLETGHQEFIGNALPSTPSIDWNAALSDNNREADIQPEENEEEEEEAEEEPPKAKGKRKAPGKLNMIEKYLKRH